jgi:hypothetical protein
MLKNMEVINNMKSKKKKEEDYLLLQMRFVKNLWKNLFVIHNIDNDCYKLGFTFFLGGDN